MATAPNPQGQPPKDDFESPLEYILPIIKKIKSKAEDARKFFKTRHAILDGEPLYNIGKSELSTKGFMGPWAFNAAQSTICAAPGVIATATCWMLWGSVVATKVAESASKLPQTTEQIDPLQESITSLLSPIDPLQESITSSLSPMVPPFTLFIVVYVAGLAFLPSGYYKIKSWKAAARKYLYLDAALGFWPQFVLASCVAGQQITARAALSRGAVSDATALFALAIVLLWLGAFIWQLYATGWRCRMLMLDYDYIDRPEMFRTIEEPSQLKLIAAGVFGIPLCIMAIQLGIYFIAFVLASLIHIIRRS